jgi:hypothetical protein
VVGGHERFEDGEVLTTGPAAQPAARRNERVGLWRCTAAGPRRVQLRVGTGPGEGRAGWATGARDGPGGIARRGLSGSAAAAGWAAEVSARGGLGLRWTGGGGKGTVGPQEQLGGLSREKGGAGFVSFFSLFLDLVFYLLFYAILF